MTAAQFGPTDIMTIVAIRGHGKTRLSKKIQAAYPRKIVIDRMDEYPRENTAERYVVRTFEQFGNALLWSVDKSRFEIVVKFDIEQDDHSEFFNQVMRCTYYRGDVLVVIEEIWNFASNNRMPKWLHEVVWTGRHQGIALLSTSQIPAMVHKAFFSQAAHVFCGVVHEKNAVEYLRASLGPLADRLSSLPRGRFAHYRPGVPVQVVSN